jgi:hypothetical protein
VYFFGVGVGEPDVELSERVRVELGSVETAFCVLLGLLGVICAARSKDAFVGCGGGGHCVGAVVEGHARCGSGCCTTD